MFTHAETFEAVLAAAAHAVAATTATPVETRTIRCVSVHTARHHLSVVLPGAGGPLDAITMSCSEDLLTRVRGAHEADGHAPPTSAFHTLVSVFRQTLAAGTSWHASAEGPALVFGPGDVPASAGGPGTFVLTLGSEGGELEVVLSFSSVCDLAEPGEASAASDVVTGKDLAGILDVLVMLELGVQVSLPEISYGPHPGNILGCVGDHGARYLAIASGVVDGSERCPGEGDEIIVFFHHEGRLLQFTSVVGGVGSLDAGAHATLPVLLVRRPERITRGQRRRAPRLVPHTTIDARIRALGSDEESSHSHAVLLDVSLLGAGIAGPLTSNLVRFEVGEPVLCSLRLPEPRGWVDVPGTVRRVSRTMQPDGSFRDVVGMEFFPRSADPRESASLDAVHELVMNESRERTC